MAKVGFGSRGTKNWPLRCVSKLLYLFGWIMSMHARKMSGSPTLPGDSIALIEEFEAGKNVYVLDGTLRSTAIGARIYDFKKHVARTDKLNPQAIPKIGDITIGFIEMLFGSMMSMKILYINDKKSSSGFSAIASVRVGSSGRERDRRGRSIFRVGDIIRGRVISLLNSSIHIAIDDKEFGVLYALCSSCSGDTVRIHGNGIKCVECGASEDRKLTDDYGKQTVASIHQGGI